MTKRELIDQLRRFPDNWEITASVDFGHDDPTIRVYGNSLVEVIGDTPTVTLIFDGHMEEKNENKEERLEKIRRYWNR